MADSVFKIVRRPIFWILLMALFLRLWGITYGLPLFLVNDETPHVYGALKMIELKTLIPAFHQEEFRKVLYYPPLLSYFYLVTLLPVVGVHYIFSGFPPLSEYKNIIALDPSFIWHAARVINAFVGAANVFVVYLLARRLFKSERTGLFAALFLSLSFYHIQLSHNARHWLPAAFLLSLIWYSALRIAEGGASFKSYFGAGVLVGLATGGVNTASVVGLVPLSFAHIWGNRAMSLLKQIVDKRILALIVISIAVSALFVALYPFGLTRAEGASGPAGDIMGRFAMLSQKTFVGWLNFIFTYIGVFWQFETPLFVAAIFGMVLSGVRRRWFWVTTAVVYAISFFALLYLFDDFTARGIVFITPILAVFAGYATDQLLQTFKARISSYVLLLTVYCLLFISFFGWQFITDFRYDWLLSQKDTRLVAREWVAEHIPHNAKIIIDGQYIRFTNTEDGIREMAVIDPSGLRVADLATLALPPERRPRPAYHLLNLNFVSPAIRQQITEDPAILRNQGFAYVIVEYASLWSIPENTMRILDGATLVRHFSQWEDRRGQSFDGSGKLSSFSVRELFAMQRFGLFVDIYKL